MKPKRRISLNKRLVMISLSVIIPMIIMVVYLLSVLNTSMNAYNKITKSVSYANQYAQDFKTQMDYSMYLSVIGGKTFDELGDGKTTVNGIVTVNPYKAITEIKDSCDTLSEMATVYTNKNQIERLKNTINSLEKRVAELEGMLYNGASYYEKMNFLDQNIYMLTELVQDGLQQYIYEETLNYENVRTQIEQQTKTAFSFSVILGVAGTALSILLSWLASRSVTKPIQTLCDSVGKVAKGDFTTQTEVPTGDEIAVLTDSFNNMTTEIGQLVEDIRIEQRNLRLTESKLLQAQINPHFLYNTLDTIVWLAEGKMNQEVVSMVTWLSDFFRTTLNQGEDFIHVRDEQSHIESYLKIQQFRYQDIMDYKIHIDSGIEDYMMPKLTLQPLVENALYHGIKNKRGKGTIEITGEKAGKHLIFKVHDNGKGMSEEELNHLRKSMLGFEGEEDQSGFGLKNVNDRIRYYYGDEYGVFFESEENIGTEATVILGTKIIEQKS